MRRSAFTVVLAASSLACPSDDGGRADTTTFTTTETTGDGDGDPSETSGNTGDGDGDGDGGDGDGEGDGDGDPAADCGNGVVEANEECDDGNPSNADDCTNTCLSATCGDGYVYEGTEECDDGNPVDTDDCTSSCLAAVCGDGYVHEGMEGCDDGNQVDDDGCSNMCQAATCGDSVVQPGEDCDDGNMIIADDCLNDCTAASCGDGYIWAGTEDCDDAGESAQCDGDCTLVSCGDMTVNAVAGEICDDGNMDNSDDCTTMCLAPACGDGFLQMGEECDGAEFGGETCVTQGFDNGDIACTMDCALDLGDCSDSPCPGGGAFVSNKCWYASQVCETTQAKCQSVGLTGMDGYVNGLTWNQQVMDAIALQLGLVSGGDAGCCVEFGWIQNGSIFTHNFGPNFYNWGNCYSNFPTLKACNVP